MPFYQLRGTVPHKRHTAFRREDGSLYYEELMGNEGFTGASSLLYHLQRPTQVLRADVLRTMVWESVQDEPLLPRHLRLGQVPPAGDVVLDRIPLFFNQDVALQFVRPEGSDESFHRNSQGDEIIYVAKGRGTLESAFGSLSFSSGDYVVIPRGIVHRYRLEETDHMMLVVESRGVVRIPTRYRNRNGQMLEGAPFSERDIRTPQNLQAHDELGEFVIHTKMQNKISRHVVRGHPFDLVGWDGTYYPWAFSIHDFEPLVGRVHQPPPVHQTFQGDGFVVCSFVPRLYDFEPDSIPSPYHHTNAQSDEMLFYVSDEFMSRKGIEFGSLSYHPDGLPHGPHPGKAEESIGKHRTEELAVMVDTFKPVHLATAALPYLDSGYPQSWLED